MSFQLSNEEKKFLLRLARQTIFDFLQDKIPQEQAFFTENLKTHTGAFVTLHKHKNLRGCIGYVSGFKPAQQAIADLAISAAFNDPRFPPLTADEFDEIDLEISILTPLQPVKDISEIEVGRDGLLIKQGMYQGLLLPQVATEYNWDVETFLEQTCRKAGLPAQAWQEDKTEIEKFSAIIFSEQDFNDL